MNRPHFHVSLIRYSTLMAVLIITIAGPTVQAAEPEHVGLTPAQRQQVQAVGHAILAAQRHAKRSAESEAIRKQIKQAKAQLDALMVPVSTGKISLASPSSTGLSASSVSAPPMTARAKIQAWHHAHAAQLAKLDTVLVHLKTRSGEVLKARMPPQPGFWQHLWARVAGRSPARPQQAVVTSLSDAALTRLGSLQSEVKAALALPEAERHQRLAALSEQLTIRKRFPMDASAKDTRGQMQDTARKETPTLISRTRHRHSF